MLRNSRALAAFTSGSLTPGDAFRAAGGRRALVRRRPSERVHRALQAEEDADRPRRDLGPHLEPVCVRLGDRVEDAAVVRASCAAPARPRSTTVDATPRPSPASVPISSSKSMKSETDLQHARAGRADRLRDADELVTRGRERRSRVSRARAVVQRPRRREPERTRSHGRRGDASHLGDLVGRRRLTVRTAITHHVKAHGAVRHLRGDVDVVRDGGPRRRGTRESSASPTASPRAAPRRGCPRRLPSMR